MESHFQRLLSSFVYLFVIMTIVFCITAGGAFCVRYLEINKVNSDCENFMSDLLAYGSLHNGFNDPVDGNYTFNQYKEEALMRYKLTEYIDADTGIQFTPAVGVNLSARSQELTVQVVLNVPVANPFSHDKRTLKPKTAVGLTHGYVKSSAQKPLPEDAVIADLEDTEGGQ